MASPGTVETESADRRHAAARALGAVARVVGFSHREAEIVACLGVLTGSWADTPPGAPPPWSGLGADASGCDLSLVLDGARTELRITTEAQAHPACPQSYWAAALHLSDLLRDRYGADLTLLRRVAELCVPSDSAAAGTLWHGAVFRDGEPPWFKVYLHLLARGRGEASATARAALARLGREDAWDALAARLGPGDEWLFLSLDLLPEARARVKVYIRHAETYADALDRAAAVLDPAQAGHVREFVATLSGDACAPILRGALTALHIEPGRAEPAHIATHLRLYPHCAVSDTVLAARLRQALAHLGLSAAPYEAALRALAPMGLDDTEAIHGWASLQWSAGRPAVSVYLSPRLHFARHGPIALDPVQLWPSPLPGFLPPLLPPFSPANALPRCAPH